jgi:hypothetical protein
MFTCSQGRVPTCPCCSGRMRMAARGTSTRATRRLGVVIWRYCNGREPTAALGTRRRAQRQPVAATHWLCCSGRVPMAAPRTVRLR